MGTTVPDGMAARLDRIRAERGYVLAFHELWAAWEPSLLDRYNAFYETLAFDPKDMPTARREFVWIAALTAAREHKGRLHVDRGRAAGLGAEALGAAVRVAAAVELYEAMSFAAEAWAVPAPKASIGPAYLETFAALATGVDSIGAHLAAAAAMAVRRQEAGCRLHLSEALGAGARPREAVEAISIAFLPGGAPALMLGAEALVPLLRNANGAQPGRR